MEITSQDRKAASYSHDMLSSSSQNKAPKKKVLALDLDETLVHCKKAPFRADALCIKTQIAGREVELFLTKRPGVEDFLSKMSEVYTIVLYTSALEEYAVAILRTLEIEHYFSQIFHRESCRLINKKLVKDVSVLGVPATDVILVDDSSLHARCNPDNVLMIEPYYGSHADKELESISDFLIHSATKPDVRPVMQNCCDYILQKNVEKVESQRDIVARTFEVKSMKKLNTASKTEREFVEIEGDLSTCSDSDRINVQNSESFEQIVKSGDGVSTTIVQAVPKMTPKLRSLRQGCHYN